MSSHLIEESRENLNFSIWADYSQEKANHKLDECIEELEEGEMPLNAYTWKHSEADLSEVEKRLLMRFFEEARKQFCCQTLNVKN